MKRDDYHVIACVILLYLYTCLKEDREVNAEYIDDVHFSIPESYFDFIYTELLKAGYIKPGASGITVKGIEYLQSDAMMEKARQYLRKAKGWPEAIAALLEISYYD